MPTIIEGDGFITTPWLEQTLVQIEALKPNVKAEFILAPEVDYRFFVSKLGEPARRYEIGGLYNPRNRSLLIVRGYAPMEDRGILNPHTEYLIPRANEDGIVDDIFFHTHPWQANNPVSYLSVPNNSCRPSDSDTSIVMTNRMIEEEDGFDRTVVSVIGSGGYLSITEATGLSLDENFLLNSGVTLNQLLVIKQTLALEPPIWLKNLARDTAVENQLLEQVRKFYLLRRTDRSTSFGQKTQDVKKAIEDLIKPHSLDIFDKEIIGHMPEYPTTAFLHNNGLTIDQSKVVQEMTGVKISIFRIIEGVGLEQLEQP